MQRSIRDLTQSALANHAGGTGVSVNGVEAGCMVPSDLPAPIWWHNGGTGGFRSFAAFDPARQVAVVVLANSAISVDDIGMHLMNPAVPLVMPMLAPRSEFSLSQEALERFVGEYALNPMMRLTITREGASLFAQATGQGRFPLTAVAADRFVFPPAGIELTFDLGESGPARALTLHQAGMTTEARRLP